MRIARVFPRITSATPTDEYVFFDEPGMFLPPIEEIHISVAFTYDLPKADPEEAATYLPGKTDPECRAAGKRWTS